MQGLLSQRCAIIEMLVVDVDGVLTDGGIAYSDQGAEWKQFHVRDGSGLKVWTNLGLKAGIITGRRSPLVQRRADELGFSVVVQGVEDKRSALDCILSDYHLRAEQVCYVGDDLPDLPLLRYVGLAVAVADACPEAIEDAHYVTKAAGGRGAVREVIELVLRAQGRWQSLVTKLRLE